MILLMMLACSESPNLFTVEDDIEIGRQLADEIEASPEEYPLLDPADFPEAYAHLDRVALQILETGEVDFADEFPWEFHLVHDDGVLNAFAAPGGFVYVYTGLIHFLAEEDELAGVLGHEIAHAAERHTTDQLTRIYGLELLLELAVGDAAPQVIEDIAVGLAGLSFSRAHETDADEHSVVYLCETAYAADGAAGFFEKLLEQGGAEPPEFLSTHPSSEGRVEAIQALAVQLGCSTEPNPDAQWQAFLDSLP